MLEKLPEHLQQKIMLYNRSREAELVRDYYRVLEDLKIPQLEGMVDPLNLRAYNLYLWLKKWTINYLTVTLERYRKPFTLKEAEKFVKENNDKLRKVLYEVEYNIMYMKDKIGVEKEIEAEFQNDPEFYLEFLEAVRFYLVLPFIKVHFGELEKDFEDRTGGKRKMISYSFGRFSLFED